MTAIDANDRLKTNAFIHINTHKLTHIHTYTQVYTNIKLTVKFKA